MLDEEDLVQGKALVDGLENEVVGDGGVGGCGDLNGHFVLGPCEGAFADLEGAGVAVFLARGGRIKGGGPYPCTYWETCGSDFGGSGVGG